MSRYNQNRLNRSPRIRIKMRENQSWATKIRIKRRLQRCFCGSECLVTDIMKHACRVAHILSEGGDVLWSSISILNDAPPPPVAKQHSSLAKLWSSTKLDVCCRPASLERGMNSAPLPSQQTALRLSWTGGNWRARKARSLQTNCLHAHLNVDFSDDLSGKKRLFSPNHWVLLEELKCLLEIKNRLDLIFQMCLKQEMKALQRWARLLQRRPRHAADWWLGRPSRRTTRLKFPACLDKQTCSLDQNAGEW